MPGIVLQHIYAAALSNLRFPPPASDARCTYAPPLDRERGILPPTPGLGLGRGLCSLYLGRKAGGFGLNLLYHCEKANASGQSRRICGFGPGIVTMWKVPFSAEKNGGGSVGVIEGTTHPIISVLLSLPMQHRYD